MKLAWLAPSAATGGLYSALTPIFALLVLAPAAYGYFSIVYLIFAFGVSVQYSVISEAWARARRTEEVATSWNDYSTSLSSLSALFAIATLIVAGSVPSLRSGAFILAAAVLFAIYRNGARYYTVAVGEVRRALISDVVGIVAFVLAVVLFIGLTGVFRVDISWLAAGATSSLVLRLPRLRWGSGLLSWSRTHGSAIRPLLLDSLLMDAGSIGTPFLLVGFLGATRFGIYRAVSNVSMPVRLLLEPLRPILGRMHPRQLFSRSALLVIGGLMVVLAGCCYLVLVAVVPRLGFQLGTLSSLVPYALSTSLYVAGNLLIMVFYIACRTNSSHHDIMTGRIFQTVLVIALPVLGFILGDLSGAIWGYTISTLLAAAAWIRLAHIHARATPLTADAPSA